MQVIFNNRLSAALTVSETMFRNWDRVKNVNTQDDIITELVTTETLKELLIWKLVFTN